MVSAASPPVPVAALVRECAPFARPKMMAAIVKVESGGNPLAMRDNATGQQYFPRDKKQATRILRLLISLGDKIDVGIAQVDTENFRKYGLNARNAFDACTNIKAGAEILAAGYRMAVNAGYSGQPAFYHAFEAYNSGRLYGDAHYADVVFRAAGIPVFLSDGVPGGSEIGIYKPVPTNDFTAPFAVAWSPGAAITIANAGKKGNDAGAKFASVWAPS